MRGAIEEAAQACYELWTEAIRGQGREAMAGHAVPHWTQAFLWSTNREWPKLSVAEQDVWRRIVAEARS